MKKREKKALELAEKKQQMTFGTPEPEAFTPKAKKGPKKTKTTYWRCTKNHIFPLKHSIHPDRIKDVRCPVCRAPVANQSNESTFLQFLDKQGRGDKKKYRKSIGKLHTDERIGR